MLVDSRTTVVVAVECAPVLLLAEHRLEKDSFPRRTTAFSEGFYYWEQRLVGTTVVVTATMSWIGLVVTATVLAARGVVRLVILASVVVVVVPSIVKWPCSSLLPVDHWRVKMLL